MKQKLRSTKIHERKGQKPELKLENDKKIIQKIKKLTAYKKAKNVLFYLPIHGEVDLTQLFEADHQKKNFVLPRMKGTSLDLHPIKNLEHTEKGKYNIFEPKSHLPTLKPQQIDLLLIPGVAFGEDGHRIGYGKGFYDRLLKKTTSLKIGIAYQFQIVKNIPGERHDIPMDMIITEQRTLKAKRKKLKTPPTRD